MNAKELVNQWKFCAMRQEAYLKENAPIPFQHHFEFRMLTAAVSGWQAGEAKRNLEARLDMLVQQWETVKKPEQKAKLEFWIDKVQSEFVKQFYCGKF